MNEKRLGWIFAGAAVFAVLAIVAVNSALARCGHCDKDKGKAAMMCPCHLKGAEVKVVNIEDGVTITITAKDKAAVKEIQEAAVNFGKGELKGCPSRGKKGLYECPMKDCYKGGKTKDGKCPHCGMKLQESKP